MNPFPRLRRWSAAWLATLLLAAPASIGAVLDDTALRTWVERFNRDDDELYRQDFPNDRAFDFLAAHVPFFDAPDEAFVRTYYFRWWVFRKHLRHTPDGWVVTEFLPPVPWAGKHNAISCPLGHHLAEGRWLRDPVYLDDDLRFWLTRTTGQHLRTYSSWIATGVWRRHLVDPNPARLRELLPPLIANFEGWEREHRRPDGLFAQNDGNDGMEVAIGGSGKRPTINSYLYGDAVALAAIARTLGDPATARRFDAEATRLRQLVETRLWDPAAGFFRVLPDGEGARLRDVDELLGYTPWLFDLPTPGRDFERAWRRLMAPDGFLAPFGPTTAEQRHPGFRVAYEGHECQWNGPSWPYATTVTLQALARTLQFRSGSPVSKDDYFRLLETYTRCHRLQRPDGTEVPWIDENLDPFTGAWLARERLRQWQNGTWSAEKGGRERGKDYNHSAYADLIISGLVGLCPAEGARFEIRPLLPPGRWPWFCLDRVRYHGTELAIVWDETGEHYRRGKGLRVFDGNNRLLASRRDLGPLRVRLR